jgi:hypothetical protein
MNTQLLRAALAFSLLVNFGVLGAVAYRATTSKGVAGLPQHLQLDTAQTQRWHEAEQGFLSRLNAGAAAIQGHRDRMIRAIFADTPDLARVDAERAAIAALQDAQQKRVIEQLLKERELLTAAQRERLAQLLLAQPAGPSGFERLHRD